MGQPTYRSTATSLSFDAFYADEFGRPNDETNTFTHVDERKGFHKNRFTSVIEAGGRNKEISNFDSFTFDNQANPNINSGLSVKQHGCPPGNQDKRSADFYFSNSVISYWQQLLKDGKKWESPINLTVFFAVGTELNRHGIRNFFESQTSMQGIVVIAGIEPPRDGPVRFGVSPSTTILNDELKKAFSMEVVFKVKVLAAFSTGYCGLNICIQNGLLEFSDVERLVFYDCLYLLGADCNTATSVNILKSKVNPLKFKLIAYKCTQGANSFASKDSVELHPSLASLFPGKKGLIENLYYNVSYTYLITHRILSTAFDDKVIAFPNDTFKKAFDDLKAVMPVRGHMISNLDTFKFAFGANADISQLTVFNNWVQTNQKLLTAFGRFLGTRNDAQSIRGLIWRNALPGWFGGNVVNGKDKAGNNILVFPGDGEENHDLLLPEFGWEYLPY